MVCIVSPRDRYTDIVPQRAIVLLFAGAIALRDSYASRPSVQSAPFEMVEMDKIVSGKTGWGDTRVKRIWKMGDRSFLHRG
ncbi:MAG: hypothetical protein ABI180_09575 [Microcoleus sp.]